MRPHIFLWLLASLLVVGPGLTQENEREPTGRQEGCRAVPDDRQDGNGGDRDAVDREEPLSQTLENCRGVLRPPPTGDGEMAEPPPDSGKTPVIRPDDLPEQDR